MKFRIQEMFSEQGGAQCMYCFINVSLPRLVRCMTSCTSALCLKCVVSHFQPAHPHPAPTRAVGCTAPSIVSTFDPEVDAGIWGSLNSVSLNAVKLQRKSSLA